MPELGDHRHGYREAGEAEHAAATASDAQAATP
jgi:hypothetical protein